MSIFYPSFSGQNFSECGKEVGIVMYIHCIDTRNVVFQNDTFGGPKQTKNQHHFFRYMCFQREKCWGEQGFGLHRLNV